MCLRAHAHSFDLAKHGRVRVGQGVAEVLSGQQAGRQAVHTQAPGVQEGVGERAHLGPVDVQHTRAQLLPQELRLGLGRRVLLHVLHKAVALGVASGGTVDQEAALQVAKRSDQLLELLLTEGVRQVGDAQQSVCGLQLHRNLPVPQQVLVELFDGTLRLLPIEQCDEG